MSPSKSISHSQYIAYYIPDKIAKAGKAAYMERNQHMIDRSDLCVFYYDKRYSPPKNQTPRNHFFPVLQSRSNSGTKLAYQYAVSKKKEILNLFSCPKIELKLQFATMACACL